ncbi:hypothetical protein T484DRAFT_1797125, partial [Baffinella frigidus]
MKVVTSLTRLAGTYADGMTVGEAPWVLTTDHVSLAVIRAPPGASSVSSTAWKGLDIAVTLARPAARRHAHAPGGNPARRDVTESRDPRDVASSSSLDVTASRDRGVALFGDATQGRGTNWDATRRRAALAGDTTLIVIQMSDAPAMVGASSARLSFGATGVFARDSVGASTDQAAGPARCPGGAYCITNTVNIRILEDPMDQSEKAREVLEEKVLFINARIGDWSEKECVASRAFLAPPLNRSGEVECSCRAEGMVQVVWDRPPASVSVSQVFDKTMATIPFIHHAPLFAIWFVYLDGGIIALIVTLVFVLYFPWYIRKVAMLDRLA